jgi:peptide/nickel transport system substrate-binding protein
MTRTLKIALAIALTALLGLGFAQQRGGTLTAAWAQNPVNLDPHKTSAYSSYQVLQQVLENLVTFDADQNLIAGLATDWSVSNDGLTWTFTLREGVKFSNGRDFTADDVVYTYDRMLDPETASGNAWRLGALEDVVAVDDTTVEMQLGAPNTGFLGKLASGSPVGIIARESVEDGTIATQPIGTGPFVITDYQPGTSVTLERNEYYWGVDANGEALPYLDRIDLQIITDESVRRSALVSGDVDWTISVPPQSLEELEGRNDVVVDRSAAPAYWYIGVNTEREPLNDVRVRQAISYALDRGQVTEAATFGTGVPTQDPIPSVSAWAFDYAPYEQDLDRARELLAEAGVESGFEMQIMPTTEYEESIRAAQVIQAQLAPLGIQATLDTREWADWLDTQGAGNYDTFVCSWNVLLDPDDFFFAQHKTGEVFNFTGYSNPTVDELLVDGREASEFAERYAIYEQVNREIVDDAAYIYLYNPGNIQAYRTNVGGYQAYGDQTIRFMNTWVE